MITLDELRAIEEMKDYPEDRWHSIRLNRLKEICRLAAETLQRRVSIKSEPRLGVSHKDGDPTNNELSNLELRKY